MKSNYGDYKVENGRYASDMHPVRITPSTWRKSDDTPLMYTKVVSTFQFHFTFTQGFNFTQKS